MDSAIIIIIINYHYYRFWLLEALRYVYNEDVFDLIATKIKSQVIDPNQAVSVLLGFAFNNNPSEKMCQDISVRLIQHILSVPDEVHITL